MTLFDAYLFIDWSARNQLSPAAPSPDAIWIGELVADDSQEIYCRGREQATAEVRRLLRAHVANQRRVLVGFDFPYGYPAGLAASLGRDGDRPWRAIWDLLGDKIQDDATNGSNRFEVAGEINGRIGDGPGPFWGRPPNTPIPNLTPTMSGIFVFPYPSLPAPLPRLRHTETAMAGVQETWKLLGAGSVGSQALLGIPRVRELRDDAEFADISAVWPFDTGLTTAPSRERGPFILHAEIWPGIVDATELAALETNGVIRDQAQVRLMCRWARDHDHSSRLKAWFDPMLPRGVDSGDIVREEGWILGCGG